MISAKNTYSNEDPPKRARGRPRLEVAKSSADRAREYRVRQKALRAKQHVSAYRDNSLSNPNAINSDDEKISLLKTILELKKDLAIAMQNTDLLIRAKQKRELMPKDIFSNICKTHLQIASKHDFL